MERYIIATKVKWDTDSWEASHITDLNEIELKQLLDEAFLYRNPGDKKNKSEIFQKLLEKAESEKEESSIPLHCFARLTRNFSSTSYPNYSNHHYSNHHQTHHNNHHLKQGGSLQDLDVVFNESLQDCDNFNSLSCQRNRRHNHNSRQKKYSSVSSRQREGGSLPSNVNVTNCGTGSSSTSTSSSSTSNSIREKSSNNVNTTATPTTTSMLTNTIELKISAGAGAISSDANMGVSGSGSGGVLSLCEGGNTNALAAAGDVTKICEIGDVINTECSSITIPALHSNYNVANNNKNNNNNNTNNADKKRIQNIKINSIAVPPTSLKEMHEQYEAIHNNEALTASEIGGTSVTSNYIHFGRSNVTTTANPNSITTAASQNTDNVKSNDNNWQNARGVTENSGDVVIDMSESIIDIDMRQKVHDSSIERQFDENGNSVRADMFPNTARISPSIMSATVSPNALNGAMWNNNNVQQPINANTNTGVVLSTQSVSSSLSSTSINATTSQNKVKNKKKTQQERNTKTVDVKSVAGYRGNDPVESLVRYIESTEDKLYESTANSSKALKNNDNKKKERKREKDKHSKVKKCTSLEELRSCSKIVDDLKCAAATTESNMLRNRNSGGGGGKNNKNNSASTVDINKNFDKETIKNESTKSLVENAGGSGGGAGNGGNSVVGNNNNRRTGAVGGNDRRSWGVEELQYLGGNGEKNSKTTDDCVKSKKSIKNKDNSNAGHNNNANSSENISSANSGGSAGNLEKRRKSETAALQPGDFVDNLITLSTIVSETAEFHVVTKRKKPKKQRMHSSDDTITGGHSIGCIHYNGGAGGGGGGGAGIRDSAYNGATGNRANNNDMYNISRSQNSIAANMRFQQRNNFNSNRYQDRDFGFQRNQGRNNYANSSSGPSQQYNNNNSNNNNNNNSSNSGNHGNGGSGGGNAVGSGSGGGGGYGRRRSKSRRKSTSSMPPSEKSDCSDLDSVHSLPIDSSSNGKRNHKNSKKPKQKSKRSSANTTSSSSNTATPPVQSQNYAAQSGAVAASKNPNVAAQNVAPNFAPTKRPNDISAVALPAISYADIARTFKEQAAIVVPTVTTGGVVSSSSSSNNTEKESPTDETHSIATAQNLAGALSNAAPLKQRSKKVKPDFPELVSSSAANSYNNNISITTTPSSMENSPLAAGNVKQTLSYSQSLILAPPPAPVVVAKPQPTPPVTNNNAGDNDFVVLTSASGSSVKCALTPPSSESTITISGAGTVSPPIAATTTEPGDLNKPDTRSIATEIPKADVAAGKVGALRQQHLAQQQLAQERIIQQKQKQQMLQKSKSVEHDYNNDEQDYPALEKTVKRHSSAVLLTNGSSPSLLSKASAGALLNTTSKEQIAVPEPNKIRPLSSPSASPSPQPPQQTEVRNDMNMLTISTSNSSTIFIQQSEEDSSEMSPLFGSITTIQSQQSLTPEEQSQTQPQAQLAMIIPIHDTPSSHAAGGRKIKKDRQYFQQLYQLPAPKQFRTASYRKYAIHPITIDTPLEGLTIAEGPITAAGIKCYTLSGQAPATVNTEARTESTKTRSIGVSSNQRPIYPLNQPQLSAGNRPAVIMLNDHRKNAANVNNDFTFGDFNEDELSLFDDDAQNGNNGTNRKLRKGDESIGDENSESIGEDDVFNEFVSECNDSSYCVHITNKENKFDLHFVPPPSSNQIGALQQQQNDMIVNFIGSAWYDVVNSKKTRFYDDGQ